MSASSKKKLRAEENAAKMTEKQRAQAKEDKKLRLYTAAFAAVMAVIVIVALVVGVNQVISSRGIREKNTTALTLGSHTLSNAELNYYFIETVNEFYSQNGSYASMFGLDLTKPLDEQVMYEDSGETWADYFLFSAEETARAVYAVVDEAEANGFTLSAEDQESVDTLPYNLETYATLYGFSDAKSYLKAMYGNGATVEGYQEYVRLNALASAYQTSYKDSLTYDDAAISAKDAEIPNYYSSYCYNQYYLSTSKYLTDDASAEEKAAAAEADAKALTADTITNADELDAAIAALEINKDTTASSTLYENQRYSSVNSKLVGWISDSARREGDRTYIANTTTSTDDDGNEVTTISGYYVVYFHDSTDNRFPMVNVRHILVAFEGGTTEDGTTVYSNEEKAAAKASAEDLLAQWKSGEATEDSFAALATENSADTGSSSNGGLYEDVYPGQMVSAFNDWCFDSSRKAGDTGIVETEYGYHVMYFSGNTDYTYREYLITNDLADDDYTTWYTTLVDSMTMTVGNTKYINTDLVLQNS